MKITSAEFISSYADSDKCPKDGRPEFAFIGRSNVGKSSLINMLTNSRHLAKTSNTPGKTQTINHFLINQSWYLVDLPGYGYAKVNKTTRAGFGKIIEGYLSKRESLSGLFILIDARLEPQAIDLDFIQWASSRDLPLALVFTKIDKLKRNELHENLKQYEKTILSRWEEIPSFILTSATKQSGKDELLALIEESM
jgi:GTP-binding protein